MCQLTTYTAVYRVFIDAIHSELPWATIPVLYMIVNLQ